MKKKSGGRGEQTYREDKPGYQSTSESPASKSYWSHLPGASFQVTPTRRLCPPSEPVSGTATIVFQSSPSLAAVTLQSGHVRSLSSALYTAQCRSPACSASSWPPIPISDLTFLWLSSHGTHAVPDVPAFCHVGPRLGRKHLLTEPSVLLFLELLFLDLSSNDK